MALRPADFKSAASASFAIPASVGTPEVTAFLEVAPPARKDLPAAAPECHRRRHDSPPPSFRRSVMARPVPSLSRGPLLALLLALALALLLPSSVAPALAEVLPVKKTALIAR